MRRQYQRTYAKGCRALQRTGGRLTEPQVVLKRLRWPSNSHTAIIREDAIQPAVSDTLPNKTFKPQCLSFPGFSWSLSCFSQPLFSNVALWFPGQTFLVFPVYVITNWVVEDTCCLTFHVIIQSVGYSSGKSVNCSLLVLWYHQNLQPSFSECHSFPYNLHYHSSSLKCSEWCFKTHQKKLPALCTLSKTA